ncbi:MAG: hypothetical protein WBC80_27270, partial [Isosphaeraceae bacterium]
AAITAQAVMHEDAAPASAAHEIGMKLLDLHGGDVAVLEPHPHPRLQPLDRQDEAVLKDNQLADREAVADLGPAKQLVEG